MAKKHELVVADFIAGALEPENQILGDTANVTALWPALVFSGRRPNSRRRTKPPEAAD
jgi:hypothetical protein